MSYETWPSTVNTKGIMPYTQTPKAYLVVEENDVGTPNVRNRSTGVNMVHRFKLKFTQQEWNLLRLWVQYNLANGALPFYFPHPISGVSTLMRFSLEDMNKNWFMSMQWQYDYIMVEFVMEEVLNG